MIHIRHPYCKQFSSVVIDFPIEILGILFEPDTYKYLSEWDGQVASNDNTNHIALIAVSIDVSNKMTKRAIDSRILFCNSSRDVLNHDIEPHIATVFLFCLFKKERIAGWPDVSPSFISSQRAKLQS
jgi:hypothetical protein